MDVNRTAHHQRLEQVTLDLADDHNEGKYEQGDEGSACGQGHQGGHEQGDGSADQGDESGEEGQHGQGQRQRDPQDQKCHTHQGGVGGGNDDDPPCIAGEGSPSSARGAVPATAGSACLAEYPNPDPGTGVEEEDRAEHGQSEPGEDFDCDTGPAERLACQRATVLGHPATDLLSGLGQIDSTDVEGGSC